MKQVPMELTLSLSATLATKAKQRFEIPVAFKNPSYPLPRSPSTALFYSYICSSLPFDLSATMGVGVRSSEKPKVTLPPHLADLFSRKQVDRGKHSYNLSSVELGLVRRFYFETWVN